MASKEYEVMFLFRAQADAAISQFRNVSNSLEAVRDRAAALQEALANIENLRAYRDRVAEASTKLEELKSREQEATAALEDAAAARAAAETNLRDHERRLSELKITLAELERKTADERIELEKEGWTRKEANELLSKQRHEINALKEEIQRETQAVRDAKRQKEEAARAERDARDAKKTAAAATKEASAELADEKKRLEETDQALKLAQVDTERLADEEKRLKAETAEATRELERLAEADKRLEAFRNTADKLRAMSYATELMAGAARPAWKLITSSVESAAALEKKISAIEAISGATAAEMALLTEQIRRTGATTVFTAEETAEAVQTMALAGWEAEQMIAGLPGVVNLAAAAGEDLAQMTSIVADGMNAFQLQGTAAATKFADVLAKAATSSNTNVGLIGESLSYVETTAGNLGYSIEDISVALAAMANNALKGSVAGASLNTTLTRMSGANATAKKQMEDMGLSMYDTATGQAKPLLQFLEELREAFQGFGDDAQAAQIAAYKLAGQRGMRGLLAIVNQSDEQWQKLVQDIYNYQGAAEQISTTRLENYAGKLQLLSDAWTDLKITIGNQLLPVATDAVETLTDLTNGANGLLETAQPLALWAAGTSGAILGMNKAMGTAATTARGLYFIMKLLPEGTKLATVLGGFGAAGLAAVAVGGLFAMFGSDAYQSTLAGTRYLRELGKKLAASAETLANSREIFDAAMQPGATNADKYDALGAIDSIYNAEIDGYYKELRAAYEKRDAFIEELKAKGNYGYRFDPITGEDVLDLNSMTTTERASLEAYESAIEEIGGKIAKRKSEQIAYREQLIQTILDEGKAQGMSIETYQKLEASAQDMAETWAKVWDTTNEAYSSVFGLFDKAEAEKADLDAMLAGLDSQSDYWETYAENLKTLRVAAEGANIDIGGLLDRLGSTGDTKSAGYLQALVDSLGSLENPDTSKLADAAEAYETMIEKRAAAVDAFAEQDEAVLSAVEQLGKDMGDAIAETESYDAAREAMLETIRGYTDTLDAEGNEAVRAVMRLGERLRLALYPAGGESNSNGYVSTAALRGYAAGTPSAAPGLALVGERGPELLVMRGGEQVIPAGETSRLLRLDEAATGGKGGAINQFSVNVTVQGNASAETVQDLRDYGRELEAAFRRMLREQQINAQRRAYR